MLIEIIKNILTFCSRGKKNNIKQSDYTEETTEELVEELAAVNELIKEKQKDKEKIILLQMRIDLHNELSSRTKSIVREDKGIIKLLKMKMELEKELSE